jgi:hypothetical protein
MVRWACGDAIAVAADSAALRYRLDRAKLSRREGRYLLRTNLTACPREGGGDLAIRPIETPDGFLKLEMGRITASTFNQHLSRLG